MIICWLFQVKNKNKLHLLAAQSGGVLCRLTFLRYKNELMFTPNGASLWELPMPRILFLSETGWIFHTNFLQDLGLSLGMPAWLQTLRHGSSLQWDSLCYSVGPPRGPHLWGRFSLSSHLWDGWFPRWGGLPPSEICPICLIQVLYIHISILS